MKQVALNGKTGVVEVLDVARPALRPGCLLVRNTVSAVSPGTERTTVSTARDSYLKTARNRPDLVRRVLDSVKRDGVLAAYRKVQSKLGEPKALGYSSAGTVHAIGPQASGHFRVGDRVACAGAGVASHAEWIAVPENLAARIPDGVSWEAAAFSTIGAIALQGVRQAAPTLGERFAVIGLGIIGLISVQLLRANGVKVAAFDLSEEAARRAEASGADPALAGDTDDQVQAALAWTEGLGVDGVLVTATSRGDGPMVAAAGMSRDRGRVVAVGLVPFGLPREIAYHKELDLRISRSYGPGRYDPSFEEKNVDYPIGYVRWTETRNLDAFLGLLQDGRVELDSLITHRYDIDEASTAYGDLSAGDGPQPLGMLIRYPESDVEVPAPVSEPSLQPAAVAGPVSGDVGIGFIGAGAFARSVLLPNLKRLPHVALRHVVAARGLNAKDTQQKFGFAESGTDTLAILSDPSIQLVCIATRHDLHAEQVLDTLAAGKHVFVEKPLALDEEQLRRIERQARVSAGLLLVGFNRRFSPMAQAARDALKGRGPVMMTYRVNAGPLPPEHWLNDPEVGGGRLIGEGCHFVDLFSFFAGDAGVARVQATCAGRPRGLPEDFAVQVDFEDGSVGQLLYCSTGDPSLGKERLELHAGGSSVVLDDYRTCTLTRGGSRKKIGRPGKGHAQELERLVAAVRTGGPSPIGLDALIGVTQATFTAQREIVGD